MDLPLETNHQPPSCCCKPCPACRKISTSKFQGKMRCVTSVCDTDRNQLSCRTQPMGSTVRTTHAPGESDSPLDLRKCIQTETASIDSKSSSNTGPILSLTSNDAALDLSTTQVNSLDPSNPDIAVCAEPQTYAFKSAIHNIEETCTMDSKKKKKLKLEPTERETNDEKEPSDQQNHEENRSEERKRQSNTNSRKVFSCKECGKTFRWKNGLRQHMYDHSGTRPYLCDVCPKTFKTMQQLQMHKRVHTGERPYSCHTCSRTFSRKHHLLEHQNLHAGLKPFRCKCNRAFSHSSTFSHHKKTCETWSGLAKKNNHAAEKQ